MVRRLIILTLALLLIAPPGEAFAHAFGRTYNLPVPFWLYLFGASAVLVVSFVQIGLFVGAGHTLRSYPRFDLLRVGPLRALLTTRPLLFALRLLSVTLFVLVILSGLLGQQNTDHNFAPTFVWIIWWVGFSFFTALVGNLWPLINPWKVIFEWAEALVGRLGVQKGLELNEPYPTSWGVWPSVALYAIVIWVENVFGGSSVPPDVAFDSLLDTPHWAELVYLTSIPKTLGLFMLPFFYLAIYLSFVKLSQLFVGAYSKSAKPRQLVGEGYTLLRDYIPVRRLAAAYIYTLVPIAVAYQIAHYYTYLLIQGQAIIAFVSDPFGWGWDLFGTASYKVNADLVGAAFVWYSQVALIVVGHVIAVYLAHIVALSLLQDQRLAMRSQYPILALMILYTIFSLWILSQPIATENPVENPPQPNPTEDIRQPPMAPPPDIR